MATFLDSFFTQSMVVLASNPGTTDASDEDTSVSGGTTSPPYSAMSTEVASWEKDQFKTLVWAENFSSVPVVWDSELVLHYQELGEALSQLTCFEEDNSEWEIEPSVYAAACYVAAGLMFNALPVPKVFNHGRKSVVFNWSNNADNLYLTVSSDRISALISSPERIQRRIEYPAAELIDPEFALLSIRAAYTKKPARRLITGAIASDAAELVG